MECVGATENPQVQQAAMLLASSIASIAPELILHSVMPLFTFAGKGIMRNNDEYSAHVIEKVCCTHATEETLVNAQRSDNGTSDSTFNSVSTQAEGRSLN